MAFQVKDLMVNVMPEHHRPDGEDGKVCCILSIPSCTCTVCTKSCTCTICTQTCADSLWDGPDRETNSFCLATLDELRGDLAAMLQG